MEALHHNWQLWAAWETESRELVLLIATIRRQNELFVTFIFALSHCTCVNVPKCIYYYILFENIKSTIKLQYSVSISFKMCVSNFSLLNVLSWSSKINEVIKQRLRLHALLTQIIKIVRLEAYTWNNLWTLALFIKPPSFFLVNMRL